MATKKINVKAPTKKETADASGQMRKGHASGGRVEAEQRIAKKGSPKKKG